MNFEITPEMIAEAESTLHSTYVDMMVNFIREHKLKHSAPTQVARLYQGLPLRNPTRGKPVPTDEFIVEIVIEALKWIWRVEP